MSVRLNLSSIKIHLTKVVITETAASLNSRIKGKTLFPKGLVMISFQTQTHQIGRTPSKSNTNLLPLQLRTINTDIKLKTSKSSLNTSKTQELARQAVALMPSLIEVLGLLLRMNHQLFSIRECANNKLQSRHHQDPKVSFEPLKRLYARTRQLTGRNKPNLLNTRLKSKPLCLLKKLLT